MANTDANIAVRVGADLTPLQRDLTKAKKELRGFGRTAKQVAGGIAKVGAAGAASAAALGALAAQSAASARELNNLIRISGSTSEEFQLLARQTRSVGVEQEQLGDILKDTREKMGEFVATGGGGFADFAEKMRLSTEAVNREFGHLSGPQILGKMAQMLNDVNVPLEQQTFFFESVASESSRLIPIFKELNNQGGLLSANMRAVILSDDELEKLQTLGDSFGNLADDIGNTFSRLVAMAAPDLTEWIDLMRQKLVDLNENALGQTVQKLDELRGQADDDGVLTIRITGGSEELTTEDVGAYIEAIHKVYDDGFGAINGMIDGHMSEQKRIVVGAGFDIVKSMSAQSKKAFEVQKAAKLAEAVVDGYRAATAAWSRGMAVGGPPVAAAFTAASIARTAALVNSIRSTSIGGGGGGAGGGGGGAAAGGETAQQAQQPENQIVTINLEGEIFGREQVRGLIGEINEALDDGFTLRV